MRIIPLVYQLFHNSAFYLCCTHNSMPHSPEKAGKAIAGKVTLCRPRCGYTCNQVKIRPYKSGSRFSVACSMCSQQDTHRSHCLHEFFSEDYRSQASTFHTFAEHNFSTHTFPERSCAVAWYLECFANTFTSQNIWHINTTRVYLRNKTLLFLHAV